MLSHPAVASFNAIIMFLISSGVVGSRNIVEVFLSFKYWLKLFLASGILDARLGPTLTKYLLKVVDISL